MTEEIVRLPETMVPRIRKYIEAANAVKVAEKTAREARAVMIAARDEILGAMKRPVAFCGKMMLTAKESDELQASLRLKDGRKIPLRDIESMIVAHRRLDGALIEGAFAGRGSSVSLDVSAAP